MAIETWFLAIFDQRLSIVKSIFDCCLSGVLNDKEIVKNKLLYLYDNKKGGFLEMCKYTKVKNELSIWKKWHYFLKIKPQCLEHLCLRDAGKNFKIVHSTTHCFDDV